MQKILSNTAKIRFQDCDPFRHLNNSAYIDYFFNAREDHLADNYGVEMGEVFEKEGVAWIISANEISYLRAAKAMEVVQIESQTLSYDQKSCKVEMRMYDAAGEKLKALIWMHFIHVDVASQRLTRHADKYMKIFEETVCPVEEESFFERVRAIPKKRKKPALNV